MVLRDSDSYDARVVVKHEQPGLANSSSDIHQQQPSGHKRQNNHPDDSSSSYDNIARS